MRSTWLLGVGVILITAAGCTSSPASHRPATGTTPAAGAATTPPLASKALASKPPVTKPHVTRPPASTRRPTPDPVPVAVVRTTSRTIATTPEKVTVQLVVRPVHGDGTAVSGYRVVPESDGGPTQCQDPSPVAVSRNIRFCGDSALDTVACWSSATPSHALCLRTPFSRVLARIPYTGGFAPLVAPAHPSPQALVLDDGTRCVIRDGGAWDTVPGHPTWFGAYSCTGGVDVYGPNPDGVDRTAPLWTVHTLQDTDTARIRSHTVISAYFVGTA